MMDSEILRFIKQQIKRELNIILSGSSGQNSKVISEDIENLYPGMPTIEQRPVMHPFGFVSRAPRNTIQVTAKQGDHPGNRLVLGHRDAKRPVNLTEGDAALYSTDGSKIVAVVYADAQGNIFIADSPEATSTRSEFNADGTVSLGANASHAVGLADILQDRIEAIESKLNSLIGAMSGHTHGVTTAPGTTGPAGVVSNLIPDTTALGSSKVQVAT